MSYIKMDINRILFVFFIFIVVGLAGCSPIKESTGYFDVSEETNHQEYDEITVDSNGSFERKFTWFYEGYKLQISMRFFPETYEIYKNRTRKRTYDLFASDSYDDELIKSIADSLNKLGKEEGFEDSEIPYIAASFVQSLEYTSDSVTTGFDEYPRFPYETLYDNGGDCEDTSILTVAILQELDMVLF